MKSCINIFEFESKSQNSHHDLLDLIFFPKLLKNFKFELKSQNSHHDLSDFIFFPKFLNILNLNPKVGTAIMTCPTSYFSLNF